MFLRDYAIKWHFYCPLSLMSLHYLAKQKNAKSHLINAALKGFLESNQKLLDFLNIADLKLQHTHTFKSPFSGTTQASRYKYGFQ